MNSLRARLNNKDWDGKSKSLSDGKNHDGGAENLADDNIDGRYIAYLTAMKDGSIAIGAPVYFFFTIKTDNLTDASQLLNVDEIAKVAKKYNLKVKIVGAADAATGTDAINETLSRKRADYIKRLMRDRGVPSENIKTSHEGGINDYSPVQANSNTCVILSF